MVPGNFGGKMRKYLITTILLCLAACTVENPCSGPIYLRDGAWVKSCSSEDYSVTDYSVTDYSVTDYSVMDYTLPQPRYTECPRGVVDCPGGHVCFGPVDDIIFDGHQAGSRVCLSSQRVVPYYEGESMCQVDLDLVDGDSTLLEIKPYFVHGMEYLSLDCDQRAIMHLITKRGDNWRLSHSKECPPSRNTRTIKQINPEEVYYELLQNQAASTKASIQLGFTRW